MKLPKVYCIDCKYYNQSFLWGDECKWKSRKKVVAIGRKWLSPKDKKKIKERLTHSNPATANQNNDCLDFKIRFYSKLFGTEEKKVRRHK